MEGQKQDAQASGVIIGSLPQVKQSFNRLLTELREVGQKATNDWPKVDPIVNRLDGASANFFSKPEAATGGEVKRAFKQHFTDLGEVCERTPALIGIQPFVAASEGMLTTFLQNWQQAHS